MMVPVKDLVVADGQELTISVVAIEVIVTQQIFFLNQMEFFLFPLLFPF